eukprot:1068378-Rhodomonas_salina.1
MIPGNSGLTRQHPRARNIELLEDRCLLAAVKVEKARRTHARAAEYGALTAGLAAVLAERSDRTSGGSNLNHEHFVGSHSGEDCDGWVEGAAVTVDGNGLRGLVRRGVDEAEAELHRRAACDLGGCHELQHPAGTSPRARS